MRSSSCSLGARTMQSRTGGIVISARSSGGRHVKRKAKKSRASASTPRRGGRRACCRRGILQRRDSFCHLPLPLPRAPPSRPCCRSPRPRRTTTGRWRRYLSSALPLNPASRLRICCSSPAVVRRRLPAQRVVAQRVALPVPRARRIACRWPPCRPRSSAVRARARPIGSTRPPRPLVRSGTGVAGARRHRSCRRTPALRTRPSRPAPESASGCHSPPPRLPSLRPRATSSRVRPPRWRGSCWSCAAELREAPAKLGILGMVPGWLCNVCPARTHLAKVVNCTRHVCAIDSSRQRKLNTHRPHRRQRQREIENTHTRHNVKTRREYF